MLVASVLAAVSPAEADACGREPGAACLFVFRQTHNDVVARASDWLIARPAKIAFIVVLSLVVHRFVVRAIRRFVDGVERATIRRGTGRPGETASLLATGPLGERAHQRAETIAVVLRSVARAVIFTMALLMVLGELEINLGPLLAGAGIVGVAVGFGAQTLVRDFLSGIFMLIEDQFGVGDTIDAGPAVGVVEGVSLRTTRLRDPDGTVWHVPNGEIQRVGNRSQDWTRAVLDVQVVHGTDLTRAQQVVKDVADDLWRDEGWSTSVVDEPSVLGVEQVGSLGITIRLEVRTRPDDHLRVLRELRQRITAAFQEAGVKVPVVQPAAPTEL